jgi:hypothetical protein
VDDFDTQVCQALAEHQGRIDALGHREATRRDEQL